ncbi:ribosome maturation factor RimP [Nocardioides marmoriginsengisoli]|uniref:Ribosome maturation factor RimP n=1 Tax=Nocardioides marmoriginsengisoli TaxID=661483 RepID=A0A3N0CNP4_9ACTN|nr:ribosome maturation factor RimP [Nocardioides marmoriginsengisoli]RNL65097.1 ribosome maturation factor RimP [Nocardioides marmoriginsengisoli]
MSSGKAPDITDRLTAVLSAPVEALGLDLEAVELSKAGKRSVLRIAVDKDGGVDMDDIAEATKAVSEVVDDSPLLGGNPFTLEVTSPGVDRPLTLPRHWRRNVTRLVKVALHEGEPVEGRILAADDAGATLEVDGDRTTIAYDAVSKAKIQIEFKREG